MLLTTALAACNLSHQGGFKDPAIPRASVQGMIPGICPDAVYSRGESQAAQKHACDTSTASRSFTFWELGMINAVGSLTVDVPGQAASWHLGMEFCNQGLVNWLAFRMVKVCGSILANDIVTAWT